ncbi:MAG: efflux RND transporter periplasmic adaptor subunit [bacterium]
MRFQTQLHATGLAMAIFALSAVAAWGHAGEVHTPPPPPESPLDRLASVFSGSNEGHSYPVDPVAISQTVPGGPGGKTHTQVITLYTPARIRVGLTEPMRVALTDVTSTPTPLTEYSPEMVIHFPSGKEETASLKEIVGSPGLYELAVPWAEAGEAKVTLTLGKGANALVFLEQPVYVKRPPVPLGAFVLVGLLVAGVIGALLHRLLKKPTLAWSLALVLGLGGALLARAPLATAAHQIEASETAYLTQAGAQAGQPWPVALPETTTTTDDTGLPLTDGQLDLPSGVRPILGTLIIPDDARAVLSAPQGGTLSSPTVLPRGTSVRKGQVLATLRVLNTEIAPDAAEAPGAVAETKARVTTAESALAQAQRDADRGERLYAAEAISKRELEDRQAALSAAHAELEAAREVSAAAAARGKALRAAGGAGTFRSVSLISPIDGVITEVGIAAGEYVEPGAMLYTVVTPGRLWIEARLFEDQLRGLAPGTVMQFATGIDPGERHDARLRSLGISLDPESRTLLALFEVIDGTATLFAGQQVTLIPPDSATRALTGKG